MKQTLNIRSRRVRALSIVEALVSLSITATLLTAVAAAYAAASDGIQHNDQFFRASQAARVSLNQIMAEVRKCQSGVVDTTSLELNTFNGQVRTYSFDAANGKLMMHIDGPVEITHAMASNVQNVEFLTDGKTISMNITVRIGSNQVTLSGSALPRRTITYE